MTTPSITSITDGQKKQLRRLAEDAVELGIEKLGLSKVEFQRVLEHGGELQSRFMADVKALADELFGGCGGGRFADEEVASRYLAHYGNPRDPCY